MRLTHLALLSIVFLDIMSQGLAIPILNTVIMDPGQDFLPTATTVSVRQFDFGLTMAVFFLAWFFGAAYISKISDFIGRKAGMLICLFGGFIGYVLTIVALDMNSFGLLLLARAVSGFTAGNQPIAQAALADMSTNEQQKTRYMGLVLLAVSVGMVAGPLISGLLSDKELLGDLASVELPFYIVSAMVIANIVLIIFYYQDAETERPAFQFRPLDVFLTLWHAAKRPVILKLSLVFFFGQLALSGFYVFMDNYFYSRFQFDTLQNAFTMIVLGGAMGTTSAFLVGPISERIGKLPILFISLATMGISVVLSIVNSSPLIAYVLIAFFFIPFALYYTTMLTLFSEAVDDTEQGWVMGVTVALFTLGAGIISLIGGWLMSMDIHLPFIVSAVSVAVAIGLIAFSWRDDDMKTLLER